MRLYSPSSHSVHPISFWKKKRWNTNQSLSQCIFGYFFSTFEISNKYVIKKFVAILGFSKHFFCWHCIIRHICQNFSIDSDYREFCHCPFENGWKREKDRTVSGKYLWLFQFNEPFPPPTAPTQTEPKGAVAILIFRCDGRKRNRTEPISFWLMKVDDGSQNPWK